MDIARKQGAREERKALQYEVIDRSDRQNGLGFSVYPSGSILYVAKM